MDVLGDATRAHFDGLKSKLDAASVPYKINNRLVRGLDYYNRTVFEWVTTKLGAQGTIAAGGRYDTLVERLGGESTPACGFGIGLERVFLLMQEYGIVAKNELDVYLVNVGEQAEKAAFAAAEVMRNSGLTVALHAGGGSFKSQMKKADRSGARFAAILGDDEAAAGEISLKPLLQAGEQMRCKLSEVVTKIGAQK
jgi:histidyl-tRNA synthetase